MRRGGDDNGAGDRDLLSPDGDNRSCAERPPALLPPSALSNGGGEEEVPPPALLLFPATMLPADGWTFSEDCSNNEIRNCPARSEDSRDEDNGGGGGGNVNELDGDNKDELRDEHGPSPAAADDNALLDRANGDVGNRRHGKRDEEGRREGQSNGGEDAPVLRDVRERCRCAGECAAVVGGGTLPGGAAAAARGTREEVWASIPALLVSWALSPMSPTDSWTFSKDDDSDYDELYNYSHSKDSRGKGRGNGGEELDDDEWRFDQDSWGHDDGRRTPPDDDPSPPAGDDDDAPPRRRRGKQQWDPCPLAL